MDSPRANVFVRFLSAYEGEQYLIPRWLFLRGLGVIFFSAFFSLQREIRGLIGEHGLLPVSEFLRDVAAAYGPFARYWIAPTLLWISPTDGALTVLLVCGYVASIALILNLWPRLSIAVALLAFLSFVGAAQDFSGYQSDGMLLEAAFLSLFFAPRGLRPKLGAMTPPSPVALWLLRWEMFRIYFESGVVKIASGEEQWRNLTAIDKYYENGPLPTWIGWYAQQHMPHSFHAFTAAATLAIELVLIWMIFLPRRWRIASFFILTPLQIGIILTANYAFLNYLVLLLGVLLLDDRFVWSAGFPAGRRGGFPAAASSGEGKDALAPAGRMPALQPARWRVVAAAATLAWIFYSSIVLFVGRALPTPLIAPAAILAPFRIVNTYGLFAVMTRERDEIEFQGTLDGHTWVPYAFGHKPQDVREAPRIYAPYQPRFDWNLWFASLGDYRSNPWVVRVGIGLLNRDEPVLRLFRRDPFNGKPPRAVRTLRWRYWFTTPAERARTGNWWNRVLLGSYAPTLGRDENGVIVPFETEETTVTPDGIPAPQ